MKLNYAGIQNRTAWEQAEVKLPSFDWKEMAAETEKAPTWVHFGAGNIFRGFIAVLQQRFALLLRWVCVITISVEAGFGAALASPF